MPHRHKLLSIGEDLKYLHSLPENERIQYIQSLAKEREVYIQKFLDELIGLFDTKYHVEISCDASAAEKLSMTYFYLCYKFLKPSVPDRVNRYKMAALMELIIIKEQFIHHPEIKSKKRTNAIAGMSAAISLINSMIYHDNEDGFYIDTRNKMIDDRIRVVLKNHLVWLTTNGLNSSAQGVELPVFITSQFHELLEILASAPLQIN